MPTKRDDASGNVVDRLTIPGSPAEPFAEAVNFPVGNASRRIFLRRSGTLAGGALATAASLVGATPLVIPESNQTLGKPIPENEYE